MIYCLFLIGIPLNATKAILSTPNLAMKPLYYGALKISSLEATAEFIIYLIELKDKMIFAVNFCSIYQTEVQQSSKLQLKTKIQNYLMHSIKVKVHNDECMGLFDLFCNSEYLYNQY